MCSEHWIFDGHWHRMHASSRSHMWKSCSCTDNFPRNHSKCGDHRGLDNRVHNYRCLTLDRPQLAGCWQHYIRRDQFPKRSINKQCGNCIQRRKANSMHSTDLLFKWVGLLDRRIWLIVEPRTDLHPNGHHQRNCSRQYSRVRLENSSQLCYDPDAKFRVSNFEI